MITNLEIKGFHFYEDGAKWIAKGVTYGPFRPDPEGFPYPRGTKLEFDLHNISRLGANVIRLYTLPSQELIEVAAKCGLRLQVDVPWPKHLDVYHDRTLQKLCFDLMDESVAGLEKATPQLMGIFLGNEIPSDIVRWVGRKKVEDFLESLYEHAKQGLPGTPIGFSNFPSTEHLTLNFFDFLGFNVYLENDRELYEYLLRLRNLYPEMPLVLSETGMDTIRNTETLQEETVLSSVKTAYETGLAGAFVFSWTDEWHTGNYDINDWNFGIVDKKRKPKELYYGLQSVFSDVPQTCVSAGLPYVSVIVASYNGGRTLRKCIDSLSNLNYPNYEIIVVDDGSTDQTPEILEEFTGIRVIRQENRGLSAARNAGIEAAHGEIVAFTDSDCYADPDWLSHIVQTMSRGDYVGAGGPNLTPWEPAELQRCVALAPGHATHVLLDADEAEHVPGCNMAFRRKALQDIGGFDPLFRKAGDDVDVIWRLQEEGGRIGFSPGGFVWHHRRTTIKAYWMQQMGYGEAEALLIHKHPHRFNDRGQSIWRGRIYAGPEQSSIIQQPDIHYGVFGMSGYQCIYERPEHYLVSFATSFEWWCFALLLLLMGFLSTASLIVGCLAVGITLILTGMKAHRKFKRSKDLSPRYFPAVWMLWAGQPIVRGWARYKNRLIAKGPSKSFIDELEKGDWKKYRLFSKQRIMEFWAEEGAPRVEILQMAHDYMKKRDWIFRPNNGWEPWDLSVAVSWFFTLRIKTMAEDHGAGKSLLRIRSALVPSNFFWLAAGGGLLLAGLIALQDTVVARVILILLVIAWWRLYRLVRRRIARVRSLLHDIACEHGYFPIGKESERTSNVISELSPSQQIPKSEIAKQEFS